MRGVRGLRGLRGLRGVRGGIRIGGSEGSEGRRIEGRRRIRRDSDWGRADWEKEVEDYEAVEDLEDGWGWGWWCLTAAMARR